METDKRFVLSLFRAQLCTQQIQIIKKLFMPKTFILSDSSLNSYGFKINMEKLHLKRFEANPVMLHNHYEMVGRWEDIQLKDGKLTATPVFLEGEGEELAQKVKARVESDFLKGASIGINILKVEYDVNEIPVAEVEILECSVVDIPSNANAIVLYDNEGQKLEGKALELSLKETIKRKSKPKQTNMKLSAEALKALGVEPTATAEEISTAILAMENAKELLTDKLNAEQKAKVDKLINGALSVGKFTADKKEQYLKLANIDFELAVSTIDSLEGKKTLSGKEQRSNSSNEERADWTFEDWRKKDTAGLLSIKATDPDRYAEITKS